MQATKAADITRRVSLCNSAGLGLGGVLRCGGSKGTCGRSSVSFAERCCNSCCACTGTGACCSRSKAHILLPKDFQQLPFMLVASDFCHTFSDVMFAYISVEKIRASST